METIESRARRLVEQEVCVCVSSLVSTLAQENGLAFGEHNGSQLSDLLEQAQELSGPIDDYEEAAIQAGWVKWPSGTWRHPEGEDAYDDLFDVCNMNDIEPHQREVFEHWAVTEWLGKKLEAKGERVDYHFAGLCVWARTTTGQAIYADAVFEAIANDCLAQLSADRATVAHALGLK